MQRFKVMVLERKRDTSGGRMVEHAGRRVPEDSIPKPLPSFDVTAEDGDIAKRAVREKLQRENRVVSGISFSADVPNGLVAYVFEKG